MKHAAAVVLGAIGGLVGGLASAAVVVTVLLSWPDGDEEDTATAQTSCCEEPADSDPAHTLGEEPERLVKVRDGAIPPRVRAVPTY
jgi:hypothetical protein